jgi:hypothetical protein
METISIQAGPFSFAAKLEVELAPKTCAAFRRLLHFLTVVEGREHLMDLGKLVL